MQRAKVLVIGLDGYEMSIGESLMSEGKLENLRSLKQQSARYLLDHGLDKYTGLAWEHFSSGLSPKGSRRWSAVNFDFENYEVVQRGTRLEPFVVNLTAKSLIFDAPYFDLERAQHSTGLVNWGAHDPGVAQMSRPSDLRDEVVEQFGPYPAADCIYAFTWPSPDKTREVGDKLVRSVDQRTQIVKWLFSERFQDWNLAIVVVSELHSVLEPMWHGIDPTHPLYHLPSAQPARAAIEAVYQGVDRLIGTLTSSLPEATVVTFAMHGMGPNEADVPSMILLPELLYRREFDRSLFAPRQDWSAMETEIPLLGESEKWEVVMRERLGHGQPSAYSQKSNAWQYLQSRLNFMTRSASSKLKHHNAAHSLSLEWMPATQYKRYWPKMEAFALPAFYDGRIRVNLEGREKNGIVKAADYDACCREIESFIRECRDIRTGEPVVEAVESKAGRDPLTRGSTEADIMVRWRGTATGFSHPKVGRIGPSPYRRTGGHTGTYGFAYIAGAGLSPGDYGVGSSFDVVPSLFQLLGENKPEHIAGQSLFAGTRKLTV